MASKTALIAIGSGVAIAAGVLAYYLIVKPPPPTGSLTVTIGVVNTTGSPVVGASVELDGQKALTDYAGLATFYNVMGGSYTVKVTATNYTPYSESIVVSQGQTSFPVTLICSITSCPCDQFLDPALCNCDPLIPATILMQNNLQDVTIPYPFYINVTCCVSGSSSYAWFGQSVPYVVNFEGTVLDASGHPICNQEVIITGLSGQTPAFSFGGPFGTGLQGYFEVSAPASVQTDSNGNFEYPVTLTPIITYYNCAYAFGAQTVSGSLTFQLNPTFHIAGTVVEQGAIANVTSQWGANFSLGVC